MRIPVLIVLCSLILLSSGPASAQDSVDALARFSTPNQSSQVGEPVDLTLTAVVPSGATIVAWPDFPNPWENFEVRRMEDLIIEQSGATVTYRQQLTVVLWLPGEFKTPEINLSYQLAGDSRRIFLPVDPAFFSVPSVLLSADEQLLPPRPPVSLAYIPPQIYVIALCILVSVVAWVYERRSKRASRILTELDELIIGELDRAALRRLQEINQQAMEPEIVYSRAADCLRDYIQRQYQMPVRNMSTLELLDALKHVLPVPLQHRLQEMLMQADIVKFSLQRPNRGDARQYVEVTARWIQAVARDIARRSSSQKEVA